MEFEESDKNVDLEQIGYIRYSTDQSTHELNIPASVSNTINLEDSGPTSFCFVPSRGLYVVDNYSDSVQIYDEGMKLIDTKRVAACVELKEDSNDDCDDSSDIMPFSITTNGVDKVYFSEINKKRVYQVDFDLNLIGFVGCIFSEPNNQIVELCPWEIHFANGALYVCDKDNSKMHLFDEDLQHTESHELDLEPWCIRVIDKIACICHLEHFCVCFYDLPSFTLKYRYNGHNGYISVYQCTIY